jgi:transcriptional regulator with XRE-family HTH domain
MEKPGTLRRRRVLAGITQAELARHVGVSPAFVSNAERGLIKLTQQGIRKFRTAIDVLASEKVSRGGSLENCSKINSATALEDKEAP